MRYLLLILLLLHTTAPTPPISITASTAELERGDRFVVTVGSVPAAQAVTLDAPGLTLESTEVLSITRVFHLAVPSERAAGLVTIRATAGGASAQTTVRVWARRGWRVGLPWVARP